MHIGQTADSDCFDLSGFFSLGGDQQLRKIIEIQKKSIKLKFEIAIPK